MLEAGPLWGRISKAAVVWRMRSSRRSRSPSGPPGVEAEEGIRRGSGDFPP